MVKLKTFNNPLEANLVKGFLNSNGIDAVVFDENYSYLNPVMTTAIGGIRLMVQEEDYETAVQILAADIDDEVLKNVNCPNCGSEEIDIKTITNLKAILSNFFLFIFGASIPTKPQRNIYTCTQCGFKW